MLVQYKGKNLYSFADKFRLVPGINEVDDSLITEAMSHPIFKRRVASGSIVIVRSNRPGDGRMSISEMKKYVPNIFDRKLLEKMLSEDERPDVQALVLKQLETVKHPAAVAGKKPKTNSLDEVEHFGGSTKGE